MKTKFVNVPKDLRKDFSEVCEFLNSKGITVNKVMVEATIKEVKEGEWKDIFNIWKERK